MTPCSNNIQIIDLIWGIDRSKEAKASVPIPTAATVHYLFFQQIEMCLFGRFLFSTLVMSTDKNKNDRPYRDQKLL
jgi:hypothetical protein